MSPLGVILCGGQSSRMGSDKGLLRTVDQTWAKLALNKFEELSMQAVLSIRSGQYERYAALFSQDKLIVDDKESVIGGPLKGLLTVHDCYPEIDLFVLACDLLKMECFVLEDLRKEYEHQNAEVTLFLNDEQVEPLCAIYTASGLAKIKLDYSRNMLEKYSLHYVIGKLSTHLIPLRKEWQSTFQNFNGPDDLV